MRDTNIGRTWRTDAGERTIQGVWPADSNFYLLDNRELYLIETIEVSITQDELFFLRNKAFRKKQSASFEKTVALEKAVQDEHEALFSGFLETLTPMYAARARKTLERKVMADGRFVSRLRLVHEVTSRGGRVGSYANKRVLWSDEVTYRPITKTEADFANYLLKQAKNK